MQDTPLSSLSPAHQFLIRRAQHLGFGRIERLSIRSGKPEFDARTRVIRRHKQGGRNHPRPQVARDDFVLKHEWREFFSELDAIDNGEVLVIEFAHGLPLFFEIEEAVV